MASDTQSPADKATTSTLGAEADPWADLTRPGAEGDTLMTHLAARYENMTRNALAGYLDTPEQTHLAVEALVKQLSHVQADVFALKSLVLGRDKMALTKDWDYQDPLNSHAALLSSSVEALREDQGQYYVLPNPGSLVGYGWHQVEEKGDSSWCWSGPETQSLLSVPRLFQGNVKITIDFNVIQRDVLSEQGALEVDGVAVPYEVSYENDDSMVGVMTAQADLSVAEAASFALVLKLSSTYSPKELWGKFDKRYLGLCLHCVTVTKAD